MKSVPRLMREARRWILWKYIKKPGIEKLQKFPMYVSGEARGAHDTPQDIAKMANYEDALKVLSNNLKSYAGLGFCLGLDGESYWQGVDFDAMNNKPWLDKLLDKALKQGCFGELSPSGNGIHIYGRGQKFDAIASNGVSGIEAYSYGRFFTFTADALLNENGEANELLLDLSTFVNEALRPLHLKHHPLKKVHIPVITPVIARRNGNSEYEDLRDALRSFNSDDRDEWQKVGHALKTHADGRELWMEWSSTSPKFKQAQADYAWNSFKPSKINHFWIFKAANERGWSNSKKKK